MYPEYMYVGDKVITGTHTHETPEGSNYYVTWEIGYDRDTLDPLVWYELVYRSHYEKVKTYLDARAWAENKIAQARTARWLAYQEHLRNN